MEISKSPKSFQIGIMINVKIVVFVVLCARNVTPQVYGLMASAKVAERTRKTKSIEMEIGNSIFNTIQHLSVLLDFRL